MHIPNMFTAVTEKQDRAAFILSQVNIRGGGSFLYRNDTVKSLSQGVNVIVNHLGYNEKSVETCYINKKLLLWKRTLLIFFLELSKDI